MHKIYIINQARITSTRLPKKVLFPLYGKTVIEKHFNLDKSIGGTDADFSLDKDEFAEMVQAVKDTEKLLEKGTALTWSVIK